MGDLGIGQGRCPRCKNGKCGSIDENHHWKESVLEIGEEYPSLDTGIRILETLQDRSEGSVGNVSGLRTLLQELIHRSHFSAERTLLQLLLDF
nr:hypothetical protein CFP56_01897 [Quercus suber]